ncbi:rhomboid family intramembrane serine protease [Coralloluteibacterium thermophilus]|uniref:Rhomboid family intramembrane serine protease n=1 Tax=Coralloluteibacterium thermophilum TaxID=2707049 RepID=A0ABV9NJG8_9GAMM
MLILPLDRPLTRETFPWTTALLVLLNVLVFCVLQAGDGPAEARAEAFRSASGLAAQETEAYRRHLDETGGTLRGPRGGADLPEPLRDRLQARLADIDPRFQARLARGELLAPDETALWAGRRAEYEALAGRSTTWRFAQRSSDPSPLRMLTAAFLHGDLPHLLGNMLFLGLVGMLVEGVVGAWRTLLLYVLGALGAGMASLAWRWGEVGVGLGASGAVSAFMGAYCVLWGLRRVRFFYWFVVVFDYVRAPAIVLLPVWLAWEVYNLLANPDAGVGFDAHAGGLLTGAALALVVRYTGGTRTGFMDAPARAQEDEAAWNAAQAALGRMAPTEAEALLLPLAARRPERIDVQVALYRCARYAGTAARARERAAAVLALTAPDPAARAQQMEVVEDAARAGLLPEPPVLLAFAARLIEAAQPAAAARVLGTSAGEDPASARLWLRLALAREAAGDAAYRETLEILLARFPATPEAGKARFLLDAAASP